MAERIQHDFVPSGFDYVTPFLSKFVRQFPHINGNVFVMMPFLTAASESIFAAVKSELHHHGMIPLRADARAFSPVLWWNVVTYMLGSSYGVVIYEPTSDVQFNPNVSIEAGFMLALDRPVLFLVNDRLKSLPVDFAGHIFKNYAASSENLAVNVRAQVKDWIQYNISYYDYSDKKLVLFVSLGGTCRCVMAKAILSDLLDKSKLSGVVVDAAAIADPHHATVSPSAIKAVAEIGCDRWIENHRPPKLCPYLQERADLIVAVTDQPLVRRATSSDNVITAKDFFGVDIPNPYPDNEDNESFARYRKVRDQMENVISANLDRILERAGAVPVV
jgi:protein-tyrosine-phosphatase